jgi:hypothetical protein
VHALSRHAWWRNPDDYRVRYVDETRVVYNADTGDPGFPRDVGDVDDYSVNSHDDGRSAAASAAAEEIRRNSRRSKEWERDSQ